MKSVNSYDRPMTDPFMEVAVRDCLARCCPGVVLLG